jgi:hypothetical protein
VKLVWKGVDSIVAQASPIDLDALVLSTHTAMVEFEVEKVKVTSLTSLGFMLVRFTPLGVCTGEVSLTGK